MARNSFSTPSIPTMKMPRATKVPFQNVKPPAALNGPGDRLAQAGAAIDRSRNENRRVVRDWIFSEFPQVASQFGGK